MSVKPRRFCATDLATLLGLPVLTVLAWASAESSWNLVSNALAPLAAPFSLTSSTLPQCIASLLELRDGTVGGARVLREVLAHQVEETLQLLACHSPAGWRPTTELRGTHNLVSALTTGNGAVLWVANSAFASLVVKMALFDAGFRVHHLSHPRHGFSNTAFGMRWLNPVRIRIESRYLASRAVLPLSNNAGPVLARLVDRLKEGGVVSVTAQATSMRPITVPFLGGSLSLAPGAPAIAHRAGAALLPVFTSRDTVDRHTVTIEPALPLPRSLSREKAFEHVAQAFAQRLEPQVKQASGQWFGWQDASETRAAVVGAAKFGVAE
jgi:lauroyl/myristoyl acyltransferase